MKRLEAPAEAATLEAKRLDDGSAAKGSGPDSKSRRSGENQMEKARLVNKPKFRP